MVNLTSLINSARVILDKRFDAQVFLNWQSLAFMTLANLLGPLHYYTRNFKLREMNVAYRPVRVFSSQLVK